MGAQETVAVRVRLLGPVDVLVGGIPSQLNGLRRKALLAGLALSAGRVVDSRRLVRLAWGDSPPATANTLQRHLSYLRTVLGSRDAIVARPPGYLLALGAEPTDVVVVERLLSEAARTTDPDRRIDLLRAAVDLFGGPPLTGLRELPWFGDQARQLDDVLLRAQVDLLEARLRRGEAATTVAELEALAVVHPWHEDIAALLMRALYGVGRQADALAAYQRVRRTLHQDLGIDPGPRLRELETAVLRQDPALIETAAPAAATVVPAQLPLAATGFTGRDAELTDLDQAAEQAGIVVLTGTAGVGKTALAVQWAHRVADRFPDGQLYANLRGYDPEQPVPATEALAGFLRALGVAGPDIPLDRDERAGRYRTALAGRRALILLDNASSAEQIRPLLPGAPGCLVVATSRDALSGLVISHGAHRLPVGTLPPAEAVSLLRRLIGARVDEEPAAAATLADQCVRLPLALRVASELANAEPGSSLTALTTALADQRQRLDLLDADGDLRTAVTSVFSWSYQRLPADAARVFRAISLHPGADFDPAAIAALTAQPVAHAARLCSTLARAHLIESRPSGRYAIHDLLRLYAGGRIGHAADDRRAMVGRLLDHYLAGAAAAMDALHPGERSKRPKVAPGETTPPLHDPGAAIAWLDAEQANLVACVAHAATHGWPSHAIRLAQTLFRHFDLRGHHAEALTVHRHARDAARQSGDRSAEARALNNLAAVSWWRAEYERSAGYYHAAVDLFRAAGDRVGEADALTNLGLLGRATGDVAGSGAYYERALVMYREAGHRIGEAGALNGLGEVCLLTGRPDQAAEHLGRALVLRRLVGKRDGEADTLSTLARVRLSQGRLGQATEYLENALTLYRDLGYAGNEANTLNTMGAVARESGDLPRAISLHEQSLELRRRTGTRNGVAATLNEYGRTLLAAGAGAEAARRHAEALSTAVENGDRYQQARAYDGLAAAHDAAGDRAMARNQWERALHLFSLLGTVESDSIRVRLRAEQN